MGRREGPSEERRAAILEAALAVFTEKGYTGASIRGIATRANVSPALLYWFFPNKEKLFAAVLIAQLDAVGVVEFPPEAMEIPPEIFLPRIAHGVSLILRGGKQVGLLRLALRESGREPELMGTLGQAITGRILAPLAAYLARQAELGRLRASNPDYMAQVFAGPMISFMLRREILEEPVSRTWDSDDYAETAVQLFLHGTLLPEGSALEPPLSAQRKPTAGRQPKAAQRIEIEE